MASVYITHVLRRACLTRTFLTIKVSKEDYNASVSARPQPINISTCGPDDSSVTGVLPEHLKMPLSSRRRTTRPVHATHTTHTTYSARPSLMTRLRAKAAPRHSTAHHTSTTAAGPRTSRRSRHADPVVTTTSAPVHHHQRKTSMSDKISGAVLKIKGSLTRRPGVKAAGTRRMRGTDGRGAHRYY